MTFQRNAGAVRRYSKLMAFGNWLQALPNRLTPAPFRLIQMGSAFWQSRALCVAAQLDVATVLGDASMDTDDLARQLGVQPDPLYRLLRMLAAMGVFHEERPHWFSNNRLSAPLRTDHPQCVRAMVLMHNSPEMATPWLQALAHEVRTGQVPFEISHGENLYGYMSRHPEFDALFARAMDSVEALTGPHFATDFDWSRFARVIDVGGSRGSKAQAILRHHPHMQALVFDRPTVVAAAQADWQVHAPPQLAQRLCFLAGDLMEGVPAAHGSGDIYLLSAVLHGMGDEDAVRVLRHVARACAGTGAAVAVMELVVPEHRVDYASAAFDMQMFMGTQGRERTLTQWRSLVTCAGLVLQEVVGLQSLGSILLLRPAAAAVGDLP